MTISRINTPIFQYKHLIMLSAQEALGLDHLYVVCHGDGPVQPLTEGISAVPLQALDSLGPKLNPGP